MLEHPLRQQAMTATSTAPAQPLTEPFVFVPIAGNEAAKGRGAAKRIVKAHVSRVQHAKSSISSSTQGFMTWNVKPYVHRNSMPVRRKAQHGTQADRKGPKRRTHSSSDESTGSESTSSEQSMGLVLPKLPSGGGCDDPFWSYPVDYRPELSPIFAHYIQNIAVDIADIDGPGAKGLLRKSWFPLIMTEAAPMFAVLLMAASHYCVLNPTKGALLDLLYLKARALSEINAALADPKRATSDATLGAVAKMAAYEAIFGDSAVFAAHMRGLQMMLKMRGGLATLGLNGLLERMLVWIDLNAAFITGLQRQLGNEELPTRVIFAAPDPYHFAGIA